MRVMSRKYTGYTSKGDGEYTDSESSEVEEPYSSRNSNELNKENLPVEPLYKKASWFVSAFGWIYYHKEDDVRKFFWR